MPNYDYECTSCGKTQEVNHPMSGPSEKIICNFCKSEKMNKLISIPYIKFEGPEWQTNDVRGIAKTDTGQDIDSSAYRD